MVLLTVVLNKVGFWTNFLRDFITPKSFSFVCNDKLL